MTLGKSSFFCVLLLAHLSRGSLLLATEGRTRRYQQPLSCSP